MPLPLPLVAALVSLGAAKDSAPALPEARPNDNRVPAGVTADGVRRIRLVVRRARWHPDAGDGPALETEAVGEEGKALTIPGPLIRVPVGTRVDATIRNALPDTIVFMAQCGVNCRDSVYIAPGATRAMPVRTDRPGTFMYTSVLFRRGGIWLASAAATESAGAIVVDSAGAPPDRVLVVAMWVQHWDTTKVLDDDRLVMTINGRMWPYTERWRVAVGDTVRWRVVNVSGEAHPMHLHGFYFRVDSHGDGATDSLYTPAQRRWAVTEDVPPFGTFTMTWVPTRAGHWLFHCHRAFHMSGFQHADLAGERLDYTLPAPHASHESDAEHVARGMAGLVLGIDVAPRPVDAALAASTAASAAPAAPRRMRLLVQRRPGVYGAHGYVLQRGDAVPAPDSVQVPGPPLVLTRGEPVEITVVNHLDAMTSVHWHGIELDSYYDGVGGWSGADRLAPRIAPNDSFVVRFTPPRAGTFMYHSHNEEVRQIGLGLYGPILVLEPGQAWDPSTDHVLVLGDVLVGGQPYLGVNGAPSGYALRLDAGKPHRLRLVNILVDNEAEVALLDSAYAPIVWRPVARDGAALPPGQQVDRPATVTLGAGETMDFQVAPKPGRYLLRVLGRGYSNVLIDIVVR
jgi:FtsP/CotA-like multicopper oxidase with cupredoxin domain